MRLIKKVLDEIPLEPCPNVGKADTKNKKLIMSAKLVPYAGGKLLVLTFYNSKGKAPYCRVFQTSGDNWINKMYDTGKWSQTALENIRNPGGDSWGTICFGEDVAIADKDNKPFADFLGGDVGNALKAVRCHQQHIIYDRAAVRRAAERESTQQIMARLPPLPEDIEKRVLEGPLKGSRYLFYSSGERREPLSGLKQRYYSGYCTHCKTERELPFIPKHKTEGECPCCGSKVRVMARGISRKYLQGSCSYLVWSAVGTAVFAQVLRVTRSYNCAPEDVITRFYPSECFYFDTNTAYKYYPGNVQWRDDDWRRRLVTDDIFDYYTYPHPKNIFAGTCLEHSHMGSYIAQCKDHHNTARPMEYLALYIKHPGIANLLDCGLFSLVRENMCGSGVTYKILDLKKLRPRDILGVSQPELDTIIKSKMSSKRIYAYKELRPCGVTLADEDSGLLDMAAENPQYILPWLKNLGVKDCIKYLKYQHRRRYDGKSSFKFICGQWRDYHSTAQKLGYDMTKKYNSFPPDLLKAHDKTAKLLLKQMALEDKKRGDAERAQWRAQYKALEGLCFEADGLTLRPVASREELTLEGERLEHCVAGYADRVKEGKTHILLLRRAEAPNMPYFTLNITPEGKFIQCHGYKNEINAPNRQRPQEIKDFEAKWFAECVPLWLKEKDKKERAARKQKQRICISA